MPSRSDLGRGPSPSGSLFFSDPESQTQTRAGKRERAHTMKPALQLKPTAPLLLIALVLLCLALSPGAQAVVPAPDGGYPGGNTAEGQAALLSLTSGTFNTAVGFASLRADSTGNFNTGVGAGTLPANTAVENTATGAAALLANTTGAQNTANGAFALFSNTAGNFNTAVGDAALSGSTKGSGNIGIGFSAGTNVGSSGNVIAIGIRVTMSTTAALSAIFATYKRKTPTRYAVVDRLRWSAGHCQAHRGDSRRRSNRWTKPAKPSWRSNR